MVGGGGGDEMPPLSPQQIFSAPEPPERTASPGEEGSSGTEQLGESLLNPELATFKHRHHFLFNNRIVHKGKKSCAYSVGLNGNLDVDNLVEQIRRAYRELGMGNRGNRVVKLGMYFSYILRTEEGYSWYSPSFNTGLSKNELLFPITGTQSYEHIRKFLNQVPIIERLSIGLTQSSRDSLVSVQTVLLWFYMNK
jgi:hypothetical protein